MIIDCRNSRLVISAEGIRCNIVVTVDKMWFCVDPLKHVDGLFSPLHYTPLFHLIAFRCVF
jgi:hypothetical protein